MILTVVGFPYKSFVVGIFKGIPLVCPKVQDQKCPLCLSLCCFKSSLNEFLSDCFKCVISGFGREVD